MSPEQIREARARLSERGRYSTHWRDCWQDHADCLAWKALDAIEERDREMEMLREVIAEWFAFADAGIAPDRYERVVLRTREVLRPESAPAWPDPGEQVVS